MIGVTWKQESFLIMCPWQSETPSSERTDGTFFTLVHFSYPTQTNV